MSLSVIIPSWNSLTQLEKNLPSVYKAAKQARAEIIVVDDASSHDSSWEYLQAQQKLRLLKCYQNDSNLGFSATVNRGVSLASGELVVLLNTDVRPSDNCFTSAIKHFKNPNIFAVGFNSQEDWMGGEWARGLFHHFRAGSKSNHNQVNPSLWASGGQAIFSKKKWDALGGMNTLYAPFYWEDTDMGYSAWKRGWKVLWSPDCKVVHDHQDSVIAHNFSRQHILNIAQRNQFLFVWKNISDPKMLMSHIIHLPYYFLRYPKSLTQAIKRLPLALQERNNQKNHWVQSDSSIIKLWQR